MSPVRNSLDPDDARAFARRWSRLWEEDYARMVSECYHDNIELVHAGWGDAGVLHGADDLRATEDRLKRLIPDHANPLVRVVVGTEHMVVESLVTGTSTGDEERMACPAVVWWRIAPEGRIAHETAYWEWGKRRPDDGTVQGRLVPGDGRPRSDGWYQRYAERLAALWTTDPERMVTELYAPQCRMERMGEGDDGVVVGREPLVRAEAELLKVLPRPHRSMEVHRVCGEDDTLAIEFEIGGRVRGDEPRVRGPGTIVLTLDANDQIVSDRAYWHLSRARRTPDR